MLSIRMFRLWQQNSAQVEGNNVGIRIMPPLVSLYDFILTFSDNAVTFGIFPRCILLAHSTNALSSFLSILRFRLNPFALMEKLHDISSSASLPSFVQFVQ